MNNGPLIVQSDRTILLEVAHPDFEDARDKLSVFAELLKSPEHIHTYLISPLSLWNAASAGHGTEEVLDTLNELSKYPVPVNISSEIESLMDRYGKIRMLKLDNQIVLETDDPLLMTEICRHKKIIPYIDNQLDPNTARIKPMSRGLLKMEMTKLGFPVEDLAGYLQGSDFPIKFRKKTSAGKEMTLREYQSQAAKAFHSGGSEKGGSGVIVLPCGAGKTIVGMAAMEMCQCYTLIVTTNVVAVRQWIAELLDKTDIKEDQIGEYNGLNKNIRPITVATYQILTYRKKDKQEFPHFDLFKKNPWGLIIYDEVHLLPAPLFRLSAEMQATRRLGLTATLVREDNKETDVFSLIGPKKFDVPWKVLEQQGWIAEASCTEIRIPLMQKLRIEYSMATQREKVTISAKNPLKSLAVKELLAKHTEDRILIIGQYIDQLNSLSAEIKVPLLTGQTKNDERIQTFDLFRKGDLPILIVSKIGNFAIDLPDANVLIQISGTFGSRQEEAQRLGRLLRPKSDGREAKFYSLVTKDSREQEFAMNRQLFLTEQGYKYDLMDWEEGSLSAKSYNLGGV